MPALPGPLRVQTARGREIAAHLPGLAALRIRVFRDFPYLYDGDEDYERRYLQTYVDCPDSVAVLVFEGERLVGASTGLPLAVEPESLTRPFQDKPPLAVERIFYCGESVLLREYRGLGIGQRFFDEREAHARALGRFDWIGFCAVQRPADHPRRPVDYQPLDGFWRKRGYEPRPDLMVTLSWKDLDDRVETPKPLMFWLRRLEA